jgi:hypothetical protein
VPKDVLVGIGLMKRPGFVKGKRIYRQSLKRYPWKMLRKDYKPPLGIIIRMDGNVLLRFVILCLKSIKY